MTLAVCVASGPSLLKEDIELFKGHAKLYVVNDCYKLALWADVLYACDEPWWKHHKGVPDFKGEKWTWSPYAAEQFNLNIHEFDKTGGNSGYQVIKLAVAQGATEIVLLGYDMKKALDGKSHWFGEHTGDLCKTSNYQQWIKNFKELKTDLTALGIEVINCTRDTALNWFDRMPPEEFLVRKGLGSYDRYNIFE